MNCFGLFLRMVFFSCMLLSSIGSYAAAAAECKADDTNCPDPKKTAALKPDYIFYNNDGIGAHAFYKPHIIVMESGLEAVYYRRVDEYPLADGYRNVFTSVGHFQRTINRYGGSQKFFKDQFLPTSTGAWGPNYGWHLLGGGFRSRLLEEYYIDNGFEHPTIMAWATQYLGHLTNEAVQAEKAEEGSVDALADLLFFDWIGKVIFLNNDFCRWTRNTLHLTEWTFQMSYDPIHHRLVNNGQQYWMRLPLNDSFSVSLLTGNMHNSISFTFNNKSQDQWTFGLGLKPEAFEWEDQQPKSRLVTWSSLFAYSKNDNPLFTLIYQDGMRGVKKEGLDDAGLEHTNDIARSRKLIANYYPQALEIADHKIGITFGSLYDGYFLGFTSPLLPAGLHAQSSVARKYRNDD